MNNIPDVTQLANAISGALAQKDFIPPHGGGACSPGSLFGGVCLTEGITSALPLGVEDSLIGKLPRKPGGSITKTASYGIVTGISPEQIGEDPATCCDDPEVTAGNMKLCTFSVPYGCYAIRTQVTDIKALGMLDSCNEQAPLIMNGNPLGGNTFGGLVPSGFAAAGGSSVNLSSPGTKALYELVTGWVRQYASQFYTGDGKSVHPWRHNVYGFQNLINTGYRDMSCPDGALCPRADSYLIPFDDNICTDSRKMRYALHNMVRTLQMRAKMFGLAPASWTLVMDCCLFELLTQILSCAPIMCGCGGGGCADCGGGDSLQKTLSAETIMRNQMAMQDGNYLQIAGMRFNVCCDPFMPYTDNGDGTRTSDIYFIPTMISGGRAPAYMDYFNFNSPLGLGDPALRQLIGNSDSYQTLDDGRFLLLKNPMRNGCSDAVLIHCPRPMLLTPQLAGRITGITYSCSFDMPQWDPTQPDFVNGGVISRQVEMPKLPTEECPPEEEPKVEEKATVKKAKK